MLGGAAGRVWSSAMPGNSQTADHERRWSAPLSRGAATKPVERAVLADCSTSGESLHAEKILRCCSAGHLDTSHEFGCRPVVSSRRCGRSKSERLA
jgi:hypothetical protein